MIGLPSGSVRLALVHAECIADFETASAQLAAAFGPAAVVEHVGSTAVPGLLAKPIVDIAIGLLDWDALDVILAQLSALGYRYRGCREDAGGHIADYRVDGVTRRHVHIVPYGSRQWRRYLVFRDHLRRDSGARATYERMKRDLAARFPNNRRAYTSAKVQFIETMTDGAYA